jgi:hypothetical protein
VVRLTGLAALAIWIVLAGSAAAQTVGGLRLALDTILGLDHAACIHSLNARQIEFTKVRRVTRSGYQMLDHAFEGHRLACEAAGLDLEIARLSAEQDRLREEREFVESGMALVRPGNDLLVPMTPRQIGLELKDLQETAFKLGGVAENLRKAAQGMLELAMTDLDRLDKPGRDGLLLALDVQSSNDILCRMLGCPPATGL